MDTRPKTEDRILAERLVGPALQVELVTSPLEFNTQYATELGGVYPYLETTASIAAARLYDPHRRHAEQVGRVVDAQMAK